MQSEHLRNVHPGWVAAGWLVAIATTSGVFMVLVGMGLVEGDAGPGFVVAVAGGFFLGGFFVGMRWSEAPILHGVALTLVSVVVLLLASAAEMRQARLPLESVPLVLGILLVQLAAAVIGGRTARRLQGG